MAWRAIVAVSILNVGIERIFRFGKSPTTFPSIQYFTSPSFCPGVFSFTINS
jgi:hypothetical protein